MDKIFYGRFDPEGKPLGFWVDDIYPLQENGSRNAAIPADAVEIPEQVWSDLLANQAQARYVEGAVTHIDPPQYEPTSNPLEDRIADLEAKLRGR